MGTSSLIDPGDVPPVTSPRVPSVTFTTLSAHPASSERRSGINPSGQLEQPQPMRDWIFAIRYIGREGDALPTAEAGGVRARRVRKAGGAAAAGRAAGRRRGRKG